MAQPKSHGQDLESALGAAAELAGPLRLAAYRYVSAQGDPVGREQVADALGITRSVAAFHLDRLADAGLLEVEFHRLSGRSGPGAGRPAKLYRCSDKEVTVTLPSRDYQLVAQLLAEAVTAAKGRGASVASTATEVARRYGLALGETVRRQAGPRASARKRLASVVSLLAEQGYEPRTTRTEIALSNCPFSAIAGEFTDLMCGMNLALIEGVLEGAGDDVASARLAPAAGSCCVRLEPKHR
jgi:predicted ArsR family transcriptional regulator